MKIFVTGGTGRLGNVLVRQLIDQGHQVTVLALPDQMHSPSLKGVPVSWVEGSVLNAPLMEQLIPGHEVVFHLAARVHLWPDVDGQTWAVNVDGTRHVAAASLKAAVHRFIHCSSHGAFEQKPFNQPLNEKRELCLHDKVDYHRAKAHAELVVLDIIKKGLPALIVNPGTVTGPYDFEPSLLGGALIDYYNGKVPMLMDGYADYADVRDIASSMITAMEKGRIGERYFLTGHSISMRHIPALLEKITGKNLPKRVAPIWLMKGLLPFITLSARLKKEQPLFSKDMLNAANANPHVSHDKANKELGYAPRSLEEVFLATFQWYDYMGWLELPNEKKNQTGTW